LLAKILHHSLSNDLLILLLLCLGGDIHADRCDELQMELTSARLLSALAMAGVGKCLVLHIDDRISRTKLIT
jgi:hypothetical protein